MLIWGVKERKQDSGGRGAQGSAGEAADHGILSMGKPQL